MQLTISVPGNIVNILMEASNAAEGQVTEKEAIISLPWDLRPAMFALEHEGLLPREITMFSWHEVFKSEVIQESMVPNGRVNGINFFFDRGNTSGYWVVHYR